MSMSKITVIQVCACMLRLFDAGLYRARQTGPGQPVDGWLLVNQGKIELITATAALWL